MKTKLEAPHPRLLAVFALLAAFLLGNAVFAIRSDSRARAQSQSAATRVANDVG